MKKTKDITKYNIHWQIVRTKAKKIKDLVEKIKSVQLFYDKNKNQDNWERAVNWLEGLSMGYKDPKNKAFIKASIGSFNKSMNRDTSNNFDFQKYQIDDLSYCLSDNIARFRKWTKSGYVHPNLTEFVLKLSEYLFEKTNSNKYKNIVDEINSTVDNIYSKGIKNTHKFLY